MFIFLHVALGPRKVVFLVCGIAMVVWSIKFNSTMPFQTGDQAPILHVGFRVLVRRLYSLQGDSSARSFSNVLSLLFTRRDHVLFISK